MKWMFAYLRACYCTVCLYATKARLPIPLHALLLTAFFHSVILSCLIFFIGLMLLRRFVCSLSFYLNRYVDKVMLHAFYLQFYLWPFRILLRLTSFRYLILFGLVCYKQFLGSERCEQGTALSPNWDPASLQSLLHLPSGHHLKLLFPKVWSWTRRIFCFLTFYIGTTCCC